MTFTASVTPQFSGTVKGSVTFYDGTTVLKTMALSGGVAKFTTSTLTSGAHSITATATDGPNTATVNFVWQVGRIRWVDLPDVSGLIFMPSLTKGVVSYEVMNGRAPSGGSDNWLYIYDPTALAAAAQHQDAVR